MTFYSTTTENGRVVFRVCAKFGSDEISVAADKSDLEAIVLFITLGLLLTAAFFSLGIGPEIGQILAAAG